MVINKLKGKSGPKSAALMFLPVLELQNGQAWAATEIIKEKISKTTFIIFIFKAHNQLFFLKILSN